MSQRLMDYGHKSKSSYYIEQNCTSSTVNNEVVKHKVNKNWFPDVFVNEFICDQIIQSLSFNDDIIYYCFYCDLNVRDLSKVRQHILTDKHIQRKGIKSYNKGLNKKFIIKSIDGKELEYLSGNEKEEMIRQELDRIPNDLKHFYLRRGIRLMNVIGEYAYYCETCEKTISSFNLIPNHLESELHQRLENRETLFNLIRSSRQLSPIVGLQFIIEYENNSMNELVYKCSFCHIYGNANQMFSHLFALRHRINLLNNLEDTNLELIPEEVLNLRLDEWHKKLGMGVVTICKETPNFNGDSSESMEQLRAIFGSIRPKTCDLMERQFSVRIQSESDAQKVLDIIEAIKDASIKYYSRKNGHNFNDNY